MLIEALGLCQICRSSTYGSFRKIQMDQHCMLCLEFHVVSRNYSWAHYVGLRTIRGHDSMEKKVYQ